MKLEEQYQYELHQDIPNSRSSYHNSGILRKKKGRKNLHLTVKQNKQNQTEKS